MENYNEQRAAILRKVENRKQHKKGSKKQGENLEVSIESEFDVYNKLRNEQAQIALIGLGYVGLPIALEFARDWPVLGYDINEERVQMMKEGRDPSNEISSSDFFERKIEFSAKESDLRKCHFFIVAVPTPIDENRNPNLGPLKSASATVGKYLKKGDYVIFESTVFPGCTEEECIPILEEVSGLKLNSDFKVGYSPERINPGDKKNTLVSIKKVVSGSDDYSLEQIAKVYGTVIKAGAHKASSIKAAEAAKNVENSQTDINIAFLNELTQIFTKLNINTSEV
ncbi:MAG: nucleotide sugar dehydrogenase, partial [Bacteroidota bacterium]